MSLKAPLTSPTEALAGCPICAATLARPPGRWRRAQLRKLLGGFPESEEDYYLLRFSGEARSALMEETLGDADVFTAGTIQEVMDRAKASATAEAAGHVRREAEQALETLKFTMAADALARAEADNALKTEYPERKAAEVRALAAEALLAANKQAQLDHVRHISARTARCASLALLVIVALLVFIGTVKSVPDLIANPPDEILGSVLSVGLAVLLVLSAAGVLFGTDLRS